MLVLTRHVGEQIIIDGNIRVTVVAVGPHKVRLGIEAPPSVPVDRMEVHARRVQAITVCVPPDPAALAAPVKQTRLREVLASYRARKAQGTNP
jgi:carbon storage regulator